MVRCIYFDMDRVLVDFGKQAEKYHILKKNGHVNWLKVFLLGSKFWSTMDYFPGAWKAYNELSEFCRKNGIKVFILSSVRLISGRRGKMRWCKEKLGMDEKRIILVRNAKNKSDFASLYSLLVDDSDQNINGFIRNSGQGYHFREWNDDVISELQQILTK